MDVEMRSGRNRGCEYLGVFFEVQVVIANAGLSCKLAYHKTDHKEGDARDYKGVAT